MKTKDLLNQLAQLERSVDDFSFEALSADEASSLKKSFEHFRNQLEDKIFEPNRGGVKSIFANSKETKNPSSTDATNSLQDQNLLLAYVSHEIRTPLNGIIGFADLLKEDELNANQLEKVNAIQNASHSLIDIINELLEYSKLSAGLETYETVDFNLAHIVNDVMYLCQTLITTKSVRLEATIDEAVPQFLVGDPSKLSQVLLNIIGNAIKFVTEGSIKLHIHLDKKRGNEYFLKFSIADTGIGIAPENLEHIFDNYKQAELQTAAQYGGTGLGLSIVKKIIENQKGKISVESELGKGTTFQFLLPFNKGSLKKLVKADTTIDTIAELDLVKELRILVFEDNILNQKLIEQRLTYWGCKTYVTDHGLYGLNILETQHIDLVLMDLKMPIMDGYEITQRIRQSQSTHIRNIPIIALTADISIHDRKKCDHYKIDDFILKPYTPDELLSKLAQIGKRSQLNNLQVVLRNKKPELTIYDDATKINLAVLLEECLGQVATLEELIILYKQNVLEFIGRMQTYIKTENRKEIEAAAHKIKSGLAMMQSKSLHGIIVQIQKACNDNEEMSQLRTLLNSFLKEYPLVEKAIDQQLEALKKK